MSTAPTPTPVTPATTPARTSGTAGGFAWSFDHAEANLFLGRARVALAGLFPYFDADVYTLQPVFVPGYGTLGVTPRRVLVLDPECVKKWDRETLASVLAHELGHLFQQHAERAEAIPHVNRKVWNIAGDAEINDGLVTDTRLKWPWPLVVPQMYGLKPGGLAEEYYTAIMQMAAAAAAAPPCNCGGAAGNSGDDENGQSRASLEAELDGEFGRSEAQSAADRLATAVAMEESEAKNPGTVPGGFLRTAKDLRKPAQVRWQDQFAASFRGRMADRPGSRKWTYRVPDRHMAGIGYGPGHAVRPSGRATTPTVVVAIDTSGSMGQAELSAGITELRHLIERAGARARFFACDAAVHTEIDVTVNTDLGALCKGGGGTDFRPVFAAVAQMKRRPDLLVFYTDGYGPAPTEAPPYPVVWLLSGTHTTVPAPWGKCITIKL